MMQLAIHDLILPTSAATVTFGKALADCVHTGDIIALSGPLAAGKTTLTRALLLGLGLSQTTDVPSPSYTLMQHYEAPPLRLPVWHIDLYRLDSELEVLGLGLEEIYDEGLTVIEWPERMGTLMPSTVLRLSLEILPDNTRCIHYPECIHGQLLDTLAL